MNPGELNDEELLRYSRQIMLPEVDIEGQEKLQAAKVLIVGLGGLGSPVAMYLACAGVGELVLADFDRVDLSNLQRQIAHTEARVGELKVESAAHALRALNPRTRLITRSDRLTEESLATLVEDVDLVLDCTDNFSTRFAINRACVLHKKPLVSGAAIRLEGQVAVFDSRDPEAPCYRCLYDEINDENMSCAQNGVLAPLVGIIGAVQATEAVKLIVGFGRSLKGRLLILDASHMQWRELKLNKDPQCPVCAN